MFKRKKNYLAGGLSEPEEQAETHEQAQSEKVGDQTVERGTINNEEHKKSKTVNKLIYALVGVVAIFIFIYFLSAFLLSNSSKKTRETKKEELVIKNSRPKNLVLERYTEPKRQETNQLEKMPLLNIEPEEKQDEPVALSSSTIIEEEIEPDRKLQGDVLLNVSSGSASGVNSGTGVSSSSQSSSGQAQHRTASETINGVEGKQSLSTSMSQRLSPTVSVPTVARKRADLTYLLRKGTNIGCTLNTKIITTHPSFTRCTVSKNVYSADGKVLLIERGSEIIGEQQTSMLQGQARVFVLWTDIETPHGVSIEINSPSAGALGESGQAAQVDRHFWERFGGAIMLSMISDGLEIAKDRASRNDRIRYDNTSESLEDIASIALENSINIPPTGYVNQGELVNVMVAQDVDFSTVYELVDPFVYNK